MSARGRREEAYVRLRSILKDAAFAPPQALKQLAAIPEFDVFVSTTFDSLLETAITQERFGGAASTDVLSYAPNRVADLPAERDRLARPVVYHLFGRVSASPTERRAVDIVQPLATLPNASMAVRRAYLETLIRDGFEYYSSNEPEACVATSQRAMQLATQLGARDLKDIDFAASFADAAAWRVGCLSELGRNAEAMQVGEDALAITDRVLAQRPGHRMALHAAQVITSGLCAVASNQLDPAQELRIGKRDQQVSQTLLALDPHNVASLNNLGVADQAMGDALWASGKFPDAIAAYHQAVEDFALATPGGSGFGIIHAANRLTLAISQARLGDASAAEATLAGEQPFLDKLRASEPPGGSFPTLLIENIMRIGAAAAAYFSGDVDRARHVAADSVQKIHAAKTEGAFQSSQVGITAYYGLHLMARVDYLHADYPAAEREERQAMADRKHWSTEGTTDQRDLAEVSTWLAMSLAKQGKLADASREIAPVVKLQRELAARNHGDIWLPTELAAALYAQALAEPSHRAPLLKEAAALLDGAAAPLKPLREIRQWRERIHQAQVQL